MFSHGLLETHGLFVFEVGYGSVYQDRRLKIKLNNYIALIIYVEMNSNI